MSVQKGVSVTGNEDGCSDLGHLMALVLVGKRQRDCGGKSRLCTWYLLVLFLLQEQVRKEGVTAGGVRKDEAQDMGSPSLPQTAQPPAHRDF